MWEMIAEAMNGLFNLCPPVGIVVGGIALALVYLWKAIRGKG